LVVLVENHFLFAQYMRHTDTMGRHTDTSSGFWITDRYYAIECIGYGGMGEVWIGKSHGDQGFQRIVAIKRILTNKKRSAHLHQSMKDEAALLSHLTAYPNIINIFDLRFDQGIPCLIMEYIDGPELKDIFDHLAPAETTLPLPVTNYIMLETSKALSYVHQAKDPQTGNPLNIIHRDLSPTNLLITSNGIIKLADFGIAKWDLQTVSTVHGEIKGKFRYMSPEQAMGIKIDYRSDYFSLGLIFYECLMGTPTYNGTSDSEVIQQAQKGFVDLQNIDDRYRPLLTKLLHPDKKQRYQNLEEFRRDLGDISLETGKVITHDSFARFLQHLHLPQLDLGTKRRIRAEHTRLDRTGAQTTTGSSYRLFLMRHWRIYLSLLVILIAISILSLASFSRTSSPSSPLRGNVEITSNPDAVSLTIQYDDTKIQKTSPLTLNDLPLETPIMISAEKIGYQSENKSFSLSKTLPHRETLFHLTPLPPLYVQFVTTPPSEVSIPGILPSFDAPSPRKELSPGTYDIIFSNPLVSKSVHIKLEAPLGGEYLCKANMQIDAITKKPTGKNPSATCTKR